MEVVEILPEFILSSVLCSSEFNLSEFMSKLLPMLFQFHFMFFAICLLFTLGFVDLIIKPVFLFGIRLFCVLKNIRVGVVAAVIICAGLGIFVGPRDMVSLPVVGGSILCFIWPVLQFSTVRLRIKYQERLGMHGSVSGSR